jgi:hypothetical protein
MNNAFKKKPKASAEDCFDRLYHNESRKAMKFEPMKEDKPSFFPRISDYAIKKKKKKNNINNDNYCPFQALYEDALVKAQKMRKRHAQLSEKERMECTFKPNVKEGTKMKSKLKDKKRTKKAIKVDSSEEILAVEVLVSSSVIVQQRDEVSPRAASKQLGTFLSTLSSLNHFNSVLRQLQSGFEITAVDVPSRNPAVVLGTVEEDYKVDSTPPPPPPPAADVDHDKDGNDVFCSICREGPSQVGIVDDNDDDDDLGSMIQLSSCQHHAHVTCLQQQLQAGWAGKKIGFSYLQCGECRTPLAHDTLSLHLKPHLQLKESVQRLCLQQAQADDLIEDFATKLESNEEETAVQCMTLLSCFLCSQCSEPFCGGRVDCAQDDQLDVSNMKCQSCIFNNQQEDAGIGNKKDHESKTGGSPVTSATAAAVSSAWRGKCLLHGYKSAIYKCDSCCSVATWDCRSNHYCQRCHGQASSAKDYKCPGKTCPLGIEHPPNKPGVHGTVDNGFVIGCSKCFLLGSQSGEEEFEFELATDDSARGAADNWKDRF